MPVATYILLLFIVVPLLVLVVDVVRMVGRRATADSTAPRPTRPAAAPRPVVQRRPVKAPPAPSESSSAIRPGEGMVYRGEAVARR